MLRLYSPHTGLTSMVLSPRKALNGAQDFSQEGVSRAFSQIVCVQIAGAYVGEPP